VNLNTKTSHKNGRKKVGKREGKAGMKILQVFIFSVTVQW